MKIFFFIVAFLLFFHFCKVIIQFFEPRLQFFFVFFFFFYFPYLFVFCFFATISRLFSRLFRFFLPSLFVFALQPIFFQLQSPHPLPVFYLYRTYGWWWRTFALREICFNRLLQILLSVLPIFEFQMEIVPKFYVPLKLQISGQTMEQTN